MDPENSESAPDISNLITSPIFWEERPITIDEACGIRLLLFGSTEKSFSTAWVKQGFMFRVYPSYGMLQLNAGPCGIMASVQACVIYELLFGFSSIALNEGFLIASHAERIEALSRALSSILWQAGQSKRAVVAKKSDDTVFNVTTLSGILDRDGILEYVKLKYFVSWDELLAHIFNYILFFMNEEGCILFVYSVLLTHGIDKIKEEMDNAEHHLIGTDGYCSLELVNLILTGKAVPNVHDGDINLDTEGDNYPLLLRGIAYQSKIGLLTMFDQRGLLTILMEKWRKKMTILVGLFTCIA